MSVSAPAGALIAVTLIGTAGTPEPNRHGCHCRQYDPSHQLFLDTTKILRINSPRTEVEDFDLNQKHNCRGARHAQAAGTLVVFYDMVKPVHTPMIRPARAYE
jgi:hypothetical protein